MRCRGLRNQINVLGVSIDVVTMDDSRQIVQDLLTKPGMHMITTANAEMVMMAQKNQELYTILQESDLVVPDGAGVLWAAEQQGLHFPERVTGCDLMWALLEDAHEKGLPVYCIGGAPSVVERAMAHAKEKLPNLPVVGMHSGFFNAEEEEALLADVKQSGVKLIFVAFGVPRQETWIVKHLRDLDGVVAMGVGGSFDVLAGEVVRAPLWMQQNRLEWLYRLYKQPHRAMRMLALPKFMWAVLTRGKKGGA